MGSQDLEEVPGFSADLELEILFGETAVIDPRTRVCLDYWRSCCKGRPMPSRGDIDPVDMPPKIMPNLALVEVVDGGARFRFRLVGGGVASAWRGRPLTGTYVCEPASNRAYGDYILGLYRGVLMLRRPIISVSNYAHPDHEHITTQRIFCPLSEDGETVSMVLAHQIFDVDPGLWGAFELTGPGLFRRMFDAVVL